MIYNVCVIPDNFSCIIDGLSLIPHFVISALTVPFLMAFNPLEIMTQFMCDRTQYCRQCIILCFLNIAMKPFSQKIFIIPHCYTNIRLFMQIKCSKESC